MSDNSSIHIGSMVVCIRDDFEASGYPDQHPYKGQILTVREVFEAPIPAKPLFLRFKEIVNPERDLDTGGFGTIRCEQCFNSEWFRPVRTTDISALKKHLVPLKDHVLT